MKRKELRELARKIAKAEKTLSKETNAQKVKVL